MHIVAALWLSLAAVWFVASPGVATVATAGELPEGDPLDAIQLPPVEARPWRFDRFPIVAEAGDTLPARPRRPRRRDRATRLHRPDRHQEREVSAGDVRQVLADTYRVMLRSFLASGARLAWPAPHDPAVSVILVLFNRAELGLRCLRALAEHATVPLELIVVDNASTDETPELLARLDGATLLRNSRNQGFLLAVNQGARMARGTHLLLLNSDVELLPGSLEAALATLDSAREIGVVGGRLVFPDGRLQEAGSLVWRDGSCLGYGRGDTPFAPPYAFRRDVDYVSGAFLLTRRALFAATGGFDEAFQPAYYEDADYCLRVWQQGLRVVYEPRAVAVHFEFASSGSATHALALQTRNRARFAAKHGNWLARREPPDPRRALHARSPRPAGLRVLLIDDRVLHPGIGSGFPRALALVQALVDLGHFVTLYPLTIPEADWPSTHAHLPATVEVMAGLGVAGLRGFLDERAGYYDRVIVSRPHNMRILRSRAGVGGRWPDGTPVIYDAEAVGALREIDQDRLAGRAVSVAEAEGRVAEEVRLADGVDAVLSVSEVDRARFLTGTCPRVLLLRHALPPSPTARPFPEREGLLFVGAFTPVSPNADSVLWLAGEILPRLQTRLGHPVPLTVAGHDAPEAITALAHRGIDVQGYVENLTPLYDRARVFVAATRFAGGVPLKVYHAAAHGLPVVTTSLLARQLGWTPGVHLLAADEADTLAEACQRLYTDATLWQALRAAALVQVERECSPDSFRDTLAEALRQGPSP